jgi:hypothetical protein
MPQPMGHNKKLFFSPSHIMILLPVFCAYMYLRFLALFFIDIHKHWWRRTVAAASKRSTVFTAK